MRKLVEEFKTGEQGERESEAAEPEAAEPEAAEALEETNLPLTHVFFVGWGD